MTDAAVMRSVWLRNMWRRQLGGWLMPLLPSKVEVLLHLSLTLSLPPSLELDPAVIFGHSAIQGWRQ